MNYSRNALISALAALGPQGLLNSGMLTSDEVPLRRKVAVYGDSRTANSSNATPPNIITENYGYASWLGQFTSGAVNFDPANNFGVGGDTSAQWAARVATVTASATDVVICLISTNDRTADFTLAQTQQNIEAVVTRLRQAKKIPVFIAETPRGFANALTAPRLAIHLQVRDWMKSYLPKIGVRVVDIWPSMINPSKDLAALGYPIEELFIDGLHPSPKGARLMAQTIAREIADLIYVPIPLPRFESYWNVTTNRYGQLNTNPLMTGTTGTLSVSANATGLLATGWTAAGSAWTGAAVKASKLIENGKDVQMLEFSGTPTSTGSLFTFEQTLVLADCKAAGTIKAIGDIEYQIEGCQGVSLDLRIVDTATWNSKCCDRYQEGFTMSSAKIDGVQETPDAVIVSGATQVKVRVSVYGSQNIPLKGYVKVRQIGVILSDAAV